MNAISRARTTLKVLFWKNYRIHCHHRSEVIYSILCPGLSLFVLVLLRIIISVNSNSAIYYQPIDLKFAWTKMIDLFQARRNTVIQKFGKESYSAFVPRFIVGYAPNNLEAFNNIMTQATSQHFEHVQVVSYLDCLTLREQAHSQNYIAGICFDETTITSSTETIYLIHRIYPNYLNFTIFLPSELRIYKDSYIGHTWDTFGLFDVFRDFTGGTDNDGGQPGYIREGFISIQHAITYAYLVLISSKALPKVYIQRFPNKVFFDDPLSRRISLCLPGLIVLGHTYTAIYLIKIIVKEKEDNQRLILRLMDVSNFLNFIAWGSQGLIIMFLSAVVQIFVIQVRWIKNYGICDQTHWGVLLLYLTCYLISTICFIYMISSFFQKATSAILLGGFLFFLSFMPYIIGANLHICGWARYALSNSVVSLGFEILLSYKNLFIEYGWENVFVTSSTGKLSLGSLMIILLALGIIYALIGLYVESHRLELGIQEKTCTWNKIKTFLRCQRPKVNPNDESNLPSDGKKMKRKIARCFQIRYKEEKCTISIKHLNKKNGLQHTIRDATVDFYEGEITVIMGHNGSGKTTLINLIAGIHIPTFGKIRIENSTLQEYLKKSPKNLSLCLRQNTLMESLSVHEQLVFFSRIRGLNLKDTQVEVDKYLMMMNLINHSNMITRHLPIGRKQVLAVCCALAGGSKIVLLDEPSAKMDVQNRTLLWEVLSKEKSQRTIIITSHSITEAEALADRILIMSHGAIKCDGTTSFLKQIYGTEMKLTCYKKKNCNINRVTQAIAKFIPHVRIECNLGSELTYSIDNRYINIMDQILKDLEENADTLFLEKILIREASIEDIFLKLGAENPSDGDKKRYQDILHGRSTHLEECNSLKFLIPIERRIGIRLFCQHIVIMLWKNYIFASRYIMLWIMQLCLLILLPYMGFYLVNFLTYRLPLPKLRFEISDYLAGSTTLVEIKARRPFIRKLMEEYNNMAYYHDESHRVLEIKNKFEEYIIKKVSLHDINRMYMIGATIYDNNITVWFNNYYLHTAPLTLLVLHNAIARILIPNHSINIKVALHPLPYGTKHCVRFLQAPASVGNFMGYIVCFLFAFITTMTVIFLVRERTSKFKLLQFVSGITLPAFWLGTFLFDAMKVLIMTAIVIITILAKDIPTFTSLHVIAWYYVIITYSNFCILLLNYVISTICKDCIAAYNSILSIGFHGGFIFGCLDVVLNTNYDNIEFYSRSIHKVFRIIPHYSMSNALIKIYSIGVLNKLCSDPLSKFISQTLESCQLEPNCCKVYEIWSWNEGIIPEVTHLFAVAVGSLIVLAYIEIRTVRLNINMFSSTPVDNQSQAFLAYTQSHSDNYQRRGVLEEQIKINYLKPKNFCTDQIICDRISKTFDKHVAVERASLAVDRAEVLGFIGLTGSGKSTFLKMIVGATKLTQGRIYINGININTDLYKIYETLSYSPQTDDLPATFRVWEILRILSMLTGISNKQSIELCESLSKVLAVHQFYNNKYYTCSNGVRRRISFAIALLGNPSIICLDEPFCCLDPASKRIERNLICELRKHRRTVIFATASARECEVLCDRIVLIYNGRMLHICSPFHLFDKLGMEGYVLRIKIRHLNPLYKTNPEDVFNVINKYVVTEFPNSILSNQCGYMLRYFIPLGVSSASQIFHKMRYPDIQLYIREFMISKVHLSTIFVEEEERLKQIAV